MLLSFFLLFSTFSSNASENKNRNLVESGKVVIDQLLTDSCKEIRENLSDYRSASISRATQYFTPIFQPDENGFLRSEDRRACLNIEGSCIVGSYLYNYPSTRETRSEILHKFGKGNGRHHLWNSTNALDPCRTIAADQSKHSKGTVVYVPSMRNKLCPQSGKPVDGCFVVTDVGAAIRGFGRFDFFTGECSKYSKRTNTCRDSLNNQFKPDKGALFYIVGRHNKRAKSLREEADRFIRNNWIKDRFIWPDRLASEKEKESREPAQSN